MVTTGKRNSQEMSLFRWKTGNYVCMLKANIGRTMQAQVDLIEIAQSPEIINSGIM